MTSLLGLLLGFGPVAVLFALVIRSGLRDDDRFGDATSRVQVEWLRHPRTGLLHARIDVDNPNDSPVLVQAGTGRARLAWSLLGVAYGRRTLTSEGRSLEALPLLGGADGRGASTWLVPVEGPAPRAVRVQVLIHQVAGRSRLHTHVLTVPAARAIAPSSADREMTTGLTPQARGGAASTEPGCRC